MLYDQRWDVDEVGRVLLSAADHMERNGWIRYLDRSADGVCMRGAVMAVSAGNPLAHEALCRLQNHLGMAPMSWNDSICQNKEQAVGALRAAVTADQLEMNYAG